MIIGFIIFLPIIIFLAVMTFFCLKGVDWVLISGIFSREERKKFKAKHDMIAMNRFIGKRVFLPGAIYTAAMFPLFFDMPWMQSEWLGAVILWATFVVMGLVFSAVPKILGTHFEKKEKPHGKSHDNVK